jgi:hypothetical protein
MRFSSSAPGRVGLTMAALLLTQSPVIAKLFPCKPLAVFKPKSTEDAPALAPVPTNPIGCVHGVRFEPEAGVTLWRCQVVPPEGKDIAEGQPEYGFLIERAGVPMQVLPDELMAGRYGAFEVIRIDLDGDDKAERVLAAWNGQGNGLGVNRWTIRVFDQNWTPLGEAINASDWGRSNLVRAPKGRKGCDLAITEFVDSPRGAGIAFQARFQWLKDGKIEAADDRPTLTRHFTFNFQRQRGAYMSKVDEHSGHVAAWLSAPGTIETPPSGAK